MNPVKTYFFNRFNTFSLLFTTSLVALMLLMMRVKLTHSFYLMFMVWNLFLAFIPFAITAYLKYRQKPPSKWKLLIFTGIWVLFLPNAPYMLTDLVHLFSTESILWLDTILIASFAINGLIFYYISVRDMKKLLKQYAPTFWWRTFFGCLPLLIALGVYIGRFQRWNSWDVLTNPLGLLSEVFDLFIHPLHNLLEWLFIVMFSGLLFMGSQLLKRYRVLEKMK